jgi:hypothetical protein
MNCSAFLNPDAAVFTSVPNDNSVRARRWTDSADAEIARTRVSPGDAVSLPDFAVAGATGAGAGAGSVGGAAAATGTSTIVVAAGGVVRCGRSHAPSANAPAIATESANPFPAVMRILHCCKEQRLALVHCKNHDHRRFAGNPSKTEAGT